MDQQFSESKRVRTFEQWSKVPTIDFDVLDLVFESFPKEVPRDPEVWKSIMNLTLGTIEGYSIRSFEEYAQVMKAINYAHLFFKYYKDWGDREDYERLGANMRSIEIALEEEPYSELSRWALVSLHISNARYQMLGESLGFQNPDIQEVGRELIRDLETIYNINETEPDDLICYNATHQTEVAFRTLLGISPKVPHLIEELQQFFEGRRNTFSHFPNPTLALGRLSDLTKMLEIMVKHLISNLGNTTPVFLKFADTAFDVLTSELDNDQLRQHAFANPIQQRLEKLKDQIRFLHSFEKGLGFVEPRIRLLKNHITKMEEGYFDDEDGRECCILLLPTDVKLQREESTVRIGLNAIKPYVAMYLSNFNLTLLQFQQLRPDLEEFASKGMLPRVPIMFYDANGVPCILSKADESNILLGVVLPVLPSDVEHDLNKYAARDEKLGGAILSLFEELSVGIEERIDKDFRMKLSRNTVYEMLRLMDEFLHLSN